MYSEVIFPQTKGGKWQRDNQCNWIDAIEWLMVFRNIGFGRPDAVGRQTARYKSSQNSGNSPELTAISLQLTTTFNNSPQLTTPLNTLSEFIIAYNS